MDRENTGICFHCFAWCISLKKSVNERWARFRNRFRRQFYGRRGRVIDPATILNETGTSDVCIAKTPQNCITVYPNVFAPGKTSKDAPDKPHCVQMTETESEFNKQVKDFVIGVITQAASALRAETPRLLGNTKVLNVNSADDNVSMTSSVISQIADAAVADSLTNIVMNTDKNQSAAGVVRPRTVKEFMEVFGIAGEEATRDGLPRVSE